MSETSPVGKYTTEAFRRRTSDGIRQYWADPTRSAEHRAKLSRPQSPEHVARRSAAMKRAWAEKKAKLAAQDAEIARLRAIVAQQRAEKNDAE